MRFLPQGFGGNRGRQFVIKARDGHFLIKHDKNITNGEGGLWYCLKVTRATRDTGTEKCDESRLFAAFLPPKLTALKNQTETPNMLKKTLLAALFAVPALSAWAETYLIDVRSPAEYAEAHADGAINIPVEDVAAKISEVTADKDADIYVYCRSGRRAGVAQETLAGLGYKKVTNLGTLANAQAFVAKQQAEKATP